MCKFEDSIALDHFLENVNCIYQTIGVLYDVKDLFNVFMRLIVPSEVISSFKPSDFNYQQNKNFKVNHHHNSNSHHQINNKQNLYENKDPFDNRGSSSWP